MTALAQRNIANPGSLPNAVREVLHNNASLGFPAVRFRQATHNGNHPDLLRVCEELVLNPNAFSAMERAVQKYSGFLTLEDCVARWGADWGFSAQAVEHAKASTEAFDKLVGYQRWVAESEARNG